MPYSIGFGTDNGTVAAADNWDGPMQVKQVAAGFLVWLLVTNRVNPVPRMPQGSC